MGKQTKIEITTGRTHKPKFGLQAAPNMVTVHDRLYPTKANFSFGWGLGMTDDAGSALINCVPNLTWLHHRSQPHVPQGGGSKQEVS